MTVKSKKLQISIWCLCLLFVLTTALGLGTLSTAVSFAEETTTSTIKPLKFKQVAAGEDFAIALTYDGDLYGMSLLEKEDSGGNKINGGNVTGLNESGATLGEYYPSTPIKIDVQFRYVLVGVGNPERDYNASTGAITNVTSLIVGATEPKSTFLTYGKKDPTNGNSEDDPKNSSIKMIAATRKTAAFITENNLIYTWGVDIDEPMIKSSTDATSNPISMNLLLRNKTDSYEYEVNKFKPSMINYLGNKDKEDFFVAPNLSALLPFKGAYLNEIHALSASEYNYNLYYRAPLKIGSYHEPESRNQNFMWGQQVYFQHSNGSYNYKTIDLLPTVLEGGESTYFSSQVFLGDGNVYSYSSDGLKVRGKNFAVPDENFSNIVNTLVSSGNTIQGWAYKDIPNDVEIKGTTGTAGALTNGFQSIAVTGTPDFAENNMFPVEDPTTENALCFYDSNNNKKDIKITRTTFSAGAGYGYMLLSGGVIQPWGTLHGGSVSLPATNSDYTQVVAGKILTGLPIVDGAKSSSNKVMVGKETYDTKWTDTTYAKLKPEFVDGKTELSAALKRDGTVSVFGILDGAEVSADITKVPDAKNNANNKFVAIFGGYGNNLFALTNLGKLYRITASSASAVDVELIDTFTDSQGNVIENWSIATTGNDAPVVTFKDGYQEGGAPTTFDNTAHVSLSGVKTNGTDSNTHIDITNDTVAVVGKNYSADAHRILVPSTSIGKTEANGKLTADALLSGYADAGVIPTQMSAPSNIGEIEFRWKESDKMVPLAVALQYVNIRYTLADTDDIKGNIGFDILPKKSTQGKTLLIKYYVGRYDNEANFADIKEQFYDVKQAEVGVIIGNTMPTRNYTSAHSSTAVGDFDLNSRIPLLDVNNPYNNKYSIAAMNVSAGFDAVFALMKNETDLLANDTNFVVNNVKDTLIAAISAKDSGFPAKSKINAGLLAYYNANAERYYDNKYQYFANDTDGDIFTFDSFDKPDSATYYDLKITNDFSVSIELDTTGWTNADNTLAALKNYFTTTGADNGGVPYFDNQYGLTISFSEITDNKVTMTFTYAIITVTATDAMPATTSTNQLSVVEYENDNISKPSTKIPLTTNNSGETSQSSGRGSASYVTLKSDSLANGFTFNTSLGGARRSLDVFTHASLIFKDNAKIVGAPTSVLGSDRINVYGNGDDSVIGTKIDPIAISLQLGKTETYNFAKLFEKLGNIRVSYADATGEFKTDDTALATLKQTFNGTAEQAADVPVVFTDVTGTSFTLKAQKATGDTPKTFTIPLRRYVGSSFKPLVYGEGTTEAAEIAYVRFAITVSKPSVDFMTLNNSIQNQLDPINDVWEISVSSRVNLGGVLSNEDTKVDVYSSNTSIVEAVFDKAKGTIRLTPKTSGTVFVTYTVSLYSYSVTDSFKVTVEKMATLGRTVNVISNETVYFSELKTCLQTATTSLTANQALHLRKEKPYYFEQAEIGSSSLTDAERQWTELETWPAFLQEPYTDKPEDPTYLRLRMGQYDPDVLNLDNTLTRCVVVFETDDGKEYKVAFHVAPGAQVAKDNGRALLIRIDKAGKTISILSNTDQDAAVNNGLICNGNSYVIPVKYLAEKIHNAGDTLNYEIIAAQALSANGTTSYNKYLDVAINSTEVIITPKYPTAELKEEGCNLQVSLQNKDSVVTVLNLTVQVTGIKTTLTKSEYTTLFLATFFSVLGLLLIIFFIRLAIYWKKKAEQRRIIKKNQMLIRMRDKMHNKTEAVSKEQLVRTKLKIEDPKYAKMFNEMRQSKEAQTGITLENSTVAQKAENKTKAEKASKKHKGKKSIDELKAELEAKRAAFAAMQSGEVPDGGIPIDDLGGMQMDQSIMNDAPVFNDPSFDTNSGYNDGLSGEDIDAQIKTHISSDDIVFDAEPLSSDDENNNL